MAIIFFVSWELWQQMTFVLACAIVVVFVIGLTKLAWTNRLMKKQGVIDEEKRARLLEMRRAGLTTKKTADVPFGIRAIQSGIEVEGIWISRPPTPGPEATTKATSTTTLVVNTPLGSPLSKGKEKATPGGSPLPSPRGGRPTSHYIPSGMNPLANFGSGATNTPSPTSSFYLDASPAQLNHLASPQTGSEQYMAPPLRRQKSNSNEEALLPLEKSIRPLMTYVPKFNNAQKPRTVGPQSASRQQRHLQQQPQHQQQHQDQQQQNQGYELQSQQSRSKDRESAASSDLYSTESPPQSDPQSRIKDETPQSAAAVDMARQSPPRLSQAGYGYYSSLPQTSSNPSPLPPPSVERQNPLDGKPLRTGAGPSLTVPKSKGQGGGGGLSTQSSRSSQDQQRALGDPSSSRSSSSMMVPLSISVVGSEVHALLLTHQQQPLPQDREPTVPEPTFGPGDLHFNHKSRKVNAGFEVLPAGTFGMPQEFVAGRASWR